MDKDAMGGETVFGTKIETVFALFNPSSSQSEATADLHWPFRTSPGKKVVLL